MTNEIQLAKNFRQFINIYTHAYRWTILGEKKQTNKWMNGCSHIYADDIFRVVMNYLWNIVQTSLTNKCRELNIFGPNTQ